MQVSLTATGGLERRLEVAIPAAQVDGEVAQRLNKISRTARLKGFRPGKAPLAVIRQQYGEQVHGEVINDLMRSSFSEAVAREKLNPAGGPRIEPIAMDPGARSQVRRGVRSAARSEARAGQRTSRSRSPVASVARHGSRCHARHAAQAASGVQRSHARGGRERSRDRRLHRHDRRRRIRGRQRRERADRHRRGPGHEGIRGCAARRRRRRHARVQRDLRAPITPTRSSRARPRRST